MRDLAKLAQQVGDAVIKARTEGADWMVERDANGSIVVTVDFGDSIVQHAGTLASVLARLNIDVPAGRRAAIVAAANAIRTAQDNV